MTVKELIDELLIQLEEKGDLEVFIRVQPGYIRPIKEMATEDGILIPEYATVADAITLG